MRIADGDFAHCGGEERAHVVVIGLASYSWLDYYSMKGVAVIELLLEGILVLFYVWIKLYNFL